MIDKIRQIKYSRLKPEERWFLDLISDLEEVKTDIPYLIYWKKNGKNLFEQNLKTMELSVSYFDIWTVFKNEYNYKYGDIQLFIKREVEKYLNWNGFIPKINSYIRSNIKYYLD